MWDTIGFGSHKLDLPPGASAEERVERNRAMLARVLNLKTTVAVVGSGCSVPLGYPRWSDFAQEVVECTLDSLEDVRDEKLRPSLERLQRFKRTLDAGDAKPESLMFYIGVCQKVLKTCAPKDNPYHQYIQERFALDAGNPDVADNPHEAIAQLPIYRFMTTNYDGEIERALSRRRDIPLEDFGLPGVARTSSYSRVKAASDEALSFTQKGTEQLSLFALARIPRSGNRVFHCHGRFDDPDSVIASEEEYQRWYFGESEQSPGFQKTVDLLLSSNPLLFIGYGLGDEDLLRPLRQLGALHPLQKVSRPVFALLPRESEEDDDQFEFLFDRYGLHVIPYPRPQASESWGRVLCEAVIELKDYWDDARFRWLKKPYFRCARVRVRAPAVYTYHSVVEPSSLELLRKAVPARVKQAEIKQVVHEGVRVLGLTSQGGCGKTWHAIKLIEELSAERSGIAGFFYWNAHFSDEVLTALERLVSYIDPDRAESGTRLERLAACIAKRRYLIVFDGYERVLEECPRPGLGRAFLSAVREFLRVIADESSRSTVVLVGSLWPVQLGERGFGNGEPIQHCQLTRLVPDYFADVRPFSWLERRHVSGLCSLLHGHTYGLTLAAYFLDRHGRDQARPRLRHLMKMLAARPPDRRVEEMIEIVIEEIDCESESYTRDLLKRLSVFTTPISHSTIRICHQAVRMSRGDSETESPPLAGILEKLLASRTVFRLNTDSEDGREYFSVHRKVRHHISGRFNEGVREVLPGLGLTGTTSGRANLYPTVMERRLIRNLFDRLFLAAKEALDRGDYGEGRVLVRRIFSLIRSRMDAIGSVIWSACRDYQHFGIRLAYLVNRAANGKMWAYSDSQDISEIEDPDGVLAAADLAWLYNDVGLSLFAEGLVADAYAVWEQSYEINQVIEGRGELGEIGDYEIQTLFNFTYCFIELGAIAQAEEYLKRLDYLYERHGSRSQEGSDNAGRIRGFKALVRHLRGDVAAADKMYADAVDILKECENKRAQCFFLHHQGNLKRSTEDIAAARRCFDSSLSLARAGRYEDLFAMLRIAEGGQLVREGQLKQARIVYDDALRMARDQGLRKTESIGLLALARLSLHVGDYAGARQYAWDALTIANELGLGLRQTHCLGILGQAMIHAGPRDLGRAYLRRAQDLAEAQQYWLRARDFERIRRELP